MSKDHSYLNQYTFPKYSKWFIWIAPLLALLLYANTLGHSYAQDDAIVITDNMHTQKGIAGIPDILAKDTFHGFFKVDGKANLVSGGRYRPLSLVMFAIEYQIFGENPFVGHLFNILWYVLLAFLIYLFILILDIFQKESHYNILLATAVACLYIAHPIHTEVVANIKGRDEIMCMLLSVVTAIQVLKYIDHKRIIHLIFAMGSFFLALMSKENAITYLAIIPISLWFFRQQRITSILKVIGGLLIPTIAFLLIRFSVLGMDLGHTPQELMNNPFIKVVDGVYTDFATTEKIASILAGLGKYIQLLLFPHPLTHDYYPRYFDVMSLADPKVIGIGLVYLASIMAMLKFWKSKPAASYCIFYFIATLSIVSNIVFPVGTHLSERFLFMPSLAFSLASGLILIWMVKNKSWNKIALTLFLITALLYSIKTISRNQIWKNDFTLFTTDVHTSTNSAKVLNAAGGALVTESANENNESKKQEMLIEAESYLKRAIGIHPNYKNAHLLLGNTCYYLKKYEEAVIHYERALQLDPSYQDAMNNLAVALRDAGRVRGEEKNDLPGAIRYLERAEQLSKNDYEIYRLLGVAYGVGQNHTKAIEYFTAAIRLQPNLAVAFRNLGTAYKNAGDEENAQLNLQKAQSIESNALPN